MMTECARPIGLPGIVLQTEQSGVNERRSALLAGGYSVRAFRTRFICRKRAFSPEGRLQSHPPADAARKTIPNEKYGFSLTEKGFRNFRDHFTG